MPYFQSTYHSKVYRDFKEIESSAFRKIVRFYEDNELEIKKLDFDENFELLDDSGAPRDENWLTTVFSLINRAANPTKNMPTITKATG